MSETRIQIVPIQTEQNSQKRDAVEERTGLPGPKNDRSYPEGLAGVCADVFAKRWARKVKDSAGSERLESFEEAATRIAKAVFPAEPDSALAARAAQAIADRVFVPNTPCFLGANTKLGQLAACFVLPVKDDLGKDDESIFETLRKAALIQQTGGGVGFDFSPLRPAGSLVVSSGGRSTGPVGFMKVFDTAFSTIAQGGSRRGANMAILRVDHPDIESFVDCKAGSESVLTNFNISVAATDGFMQAVVRDESYDLIDPVSGSPSGKRLRAKSVFEHIVRNAWTNGEPGLLFIDAVNRQNPVPRLYELAATNPCVSGNTPIFTAEGIFEAARLSELGGLLDLPVRTFSSPPGVGNDPAPAGVVRSARSTTPVFESGRKSMMAVVSTVEGFELCVTPEHLLLTEGDRWVRAVNLQGGEKLLLLDHAVDRPESAKMTIPGDYLEGFFLGYSFVNARPRAPDSSAFPAHPPPPPTAQARDLGLLEVLFSSNPADNYLLVAFDHWCRSHFDRSKMRHQPLISQTVYDPTTTAFGGLALSSWLCSAGVFDEGSQVSHVPRKVLCGSTSLMAGFVYGIVVASGNRVLKPSLPPPSETAAAASAAAAAAEGDDADWKDRTLEISLYIGVATARDLQNLLLFNGTMSSFAKSANTDLEGSAEATYMRFSIDFDALVTFLLAGSPAQCTAQRTLGSAFMPLLPIVDLAGGCAPAFQQTVPEEEEEEQQQQQQQQQRRWATAAAGPTDAAGFGRSKKFRATVMCRPIVCQYLRRPIPVYDVGVAVVHAFTAGGIVAHNCGEQPLGPYENCCLGHINLAHPKFVAAWKGGDRPYIAGVVAMGVGFLDGVIDANRYVPEIPKLGERAKRTRKIGLGITGLHDLLVNLGIPYGSKKSVHTVRRLVEFIRFEALRASVDLARKLGPFPTFAESRYVEGDFIEATLCSRHLREDDGDGKGIVPSSDEWKALKEDILRYGLRNACLLTVAPTGTVSTVMGVEGYGCEPIYSLSYTRTTAEGDKLRYLSPLFERELRREAERVGMPPELVTRIREHVERCGTVAAPADSTVAAALRGSPLGKLFGCTSLDLSLKQHMNVQVAVQQWVDSSISKTYNCPKETAPQRIAELMMQAWNSKLKGITVYRSGSRDVQVLTSSTAAQKPTGADSMGSAGLANRASVLRGCTIEVPSQFGAIFVTVNETASGVPFEVFVTLGKGGSDVSADCEAMGRLVSSMLRMPSPLGQLRKVELIVKQLEDIGGRGATRRTNEVRSIRSVPDGIAYALAQYAEAAADRGTTVEEGGGGGGGGGQETGKQHQRAAEETSSSSAAAAAATTPEQRREYCPHCCNWTLVYSEGCAHCSDPKCGYSACS